jgi:hypothetical protein
LQYDKSFSVSSAYSAKKPQISKGPVRAEANAEPEQLVASVALFGREVL